ncbi:MAG: cystathionine gamma-synthase [Pseudomonadota bacterium]
MTHEIETLYSKYPKTQPATVAVRTGIDSNDQHGAIVPPLYLSTNFSFAGLDNKRQYDYTRSGNPTRDILAEAVAELEEGCGAVITSTGMSAITLVLQLVNPGELVIAPHDCYGGTYRLLNTFHQQGKLNVEFVDFSEHDKLQDLLAKQPKLIWIETPSNPLLRLTDIQEIASKAQTVGACVVVDNTFLSPLLQKPLTLGADIVVHSTTKYINGHSDVVGGAVVCKDQALFEDVAWWANCIGVTGSPFDAFLTLRGIRTLGARLRVHQENADKIIEYLSSEALVEKIYFPGLETHPQHQLARRQQRGFGAMISFEVSGGDCAIREFVKPLKLFSLAESLGGVESLIAHPATMTHAAMDVDARKQAGIKDSLLRLSVGIEDGDDLISDLKTGFNAIRDSGLTLCEKFSKVIAV